MKTVDFTPAQLEAIDIGRRHVDACVVAGPGSGKTTVLVEYFRRLVEAGVDPLRILAITFTEKAAGNMRAKLAEAFREDAAIRAKLERAWVSTVHGFCARLLRENAVFAGVDPEFAVADEREAWRMRQESMTSALSALLAEQETAMRALIRGLSSYEFEEAVLSAYDAMRGAGIRVEELAGFAAPPGVTLADVAETLRSIAREPVTNWSYMQREQLALARAGAERIVSAGGPLQALRAIEDFSCNLTKCKRGNNAYNLLTLLKKQVDGARYGQLTEFYAAERATLFEILRRFDHIYRERKRQASVLDFADLEEFTVRLLEEHADTRERVRRQFDHILMDEFQDTNGQQARLMRLVRAPDRFYAVGDINQSIFGFRHAEPEGFEQYQKEVAQGGRLVQLTDNFRSRSEVLSAVETIADSAAGIVARPLVAQRKFETPRDVCVEVLSAADLPVEARWVAHRVAQLAEEGFHFRDFAVLVRNSEVIGEFTEAFDEAGIPYVVNRGKGFYDTREVNDLTHLLRVIANPRDEISLAAVLRSPLVAASDQALLGLKATGDNLGGSLMRIGPETAEWLDSEDERKLRSFRDRLRRWRARREYVTFDRLLMDAMDECGYQAIVDPRGAANIEKFLAQARDAARGKSLDQFVEEVALVRESDPREPDAPVDDQADAVKVMTVHSAKGLEFPVVIVAALHKGVESNPPVVAFSRTHGLGARWRNPAKREDKDDLFQHALRGEWHTREAQESDRLLYVAMTRAEQHLVLSFSARKQWAKDVADRLALSLDVPGDDTVVRTAPDGKQWRLRVVVADSAPELVRRTVNAAEPIAEVQLVDPPEVAEQQDANATVTALARFASCPREYFLSQYVGFEGRLRKLPEADDELPANELGTQVHALLAGSPLLASGLGTQVHAPLAASPLPPPQPGTEVHALPAADSLSASLLGGKVRSLLAASPLPEPDPEALRLAGVFRQSALGRRTARASRVEREFDFLMPLEGLVVRGQVDLWFEEGGELVIVDYKTDALNASQAHQRAQEYALQLRLYAMAVERVAGRAVDRAWLHFLRPNVAVEVDLAPNLLDSPEQIVRDFQEAQSRVEFPLLEGEHCLRCQFYKDLCPANPRPF